MSMPAPAANEASTLRRPLRAERLLLPASCGSPPDTTGMLGFTGVDVDAGTISDPQAVEAASDNIF